MVFDVEGMLEAVYQGRLEGQIDNLAGDNQALVATVRRLDKLARDLIDKKAQETTDKVFNAGQLDQEHALNRAYLAQVRETVSALLNTAPADRTEQWFQQLEAKAGEGAQREYERVFRSNDYQYDVSRDAFVKTGYEPIEYARNRLYAVLDETRQLVAHQQAAERQEQGQQRAQSAQARSQEVQQQSVQRQRTLDKINAMGVGQ